MDPGINFPRVSSVGLALPANRLEQSIVSDALWQAWGATLKDRARFDRFQRSGDEREPEYAPGNDTHDRHIPDEALGIAKTAVLNAEAGFEHLVIHFDFPLQTIPLHFFIGLVEVFYREIGEQHPL